MTYICALTIAANVNNINFGLNKLWNKYIMKTHEGLILDLFPHIALYTDMVIILHIILFPYDINTNII